MTAARARKYRPMTNASVAEVVSERTTKKTLRKHGVPYSITQLTVVYRLNCGHTIERTKARTTEPADVGRRMRCEHCQGADEG